jgi:hypothetical protein
MSTIVTRAGKGSQLTWVEMDANITNLNNDKIQDIVQDLTPQLGGNLDVNGNSIVSINNGNINITPHGTGVVVVDGVKLSNGAGNVTTNIAVGNGALSNNSTGSNNIGIGYYASYTTSTGSQNTAFGYEALYSNGTNNNNTALGWHALYSTTGGNNLGIGHNAGAGITSGTKNVVIGSNTGSTIATLSNNILISDGDGNIRISVNSSGAVKLGSLTYPINDGTAGQAIVTDGSGNLSFTTITGGSASLAGLTDVTLSSATNGQVLKYNGTKWVNSTDNGITAISQDTTPALGGNLDTASYTISSSTGNVLIDDLVTVDGIQFDTAAGLSADAVAKLVYDTTYGSLAYRLAGNNVIIPIGQREVQYIYNGTGATLQKGQLVYISGSQGHQLTVELADASSEATSTKTIGMVSETILNGANGFITVNGIADKIDTSLYTAGTQLWLSTTSGSFTNVRPTAPDHAVFIGWVIRQHASTGSVYVHIQNGYELEELHDVSLSASVTDNSALLYNSSTGIWNDRTLTASLINGLATVATTGSYTDLISRPSSILNFGISEGTSDQVLKTNGAGTQSFTSLKTVNGNSLVGSGNIIVTSGQGLGQIIAYKADGTQDNIAVDANTTIIQMTIGQELIMDASAKVAIETTSNYGWRDNIAPFHEKTTGLNNPSFGTIRDGLQGLLFSPNTMNQVWVDFHIDHDYALGTVLYPHVHWLPMTTGTGTVRWGIEYSVAKGHQQGASSIFPATTTVYVEQTISANSQYMHFVAEVSQANAIPSTNVEPDSVIKVRIFRDAAHVNDTYTGDVHAWQSDLHYQFNTLGTLNKAPNFYGA